MADRLRRLVLTWPAGNRWGFAGEAALARVAASRVSNEDALELERRQGNRGMPVVSLKGRLDVGSAPAFRYEVRELMKTGVTTVVLDLTDLVSIDSSGLGAVIGGLRLARQVG